VTIKETELNETWLVELTTDLVSAYVSNNPVPIGELSGLIGKVHAVLKDTIGGVVPRQQPKELSPSVPIKKSVTPDYIICLDDGRSFKSLKRHLSSKFGLTPDEYRAKWGLPSDYPMVAANYAATRSALAKSMGLGRKAEAQQPIPVKRGRKKSAS
jgi:predicted transcriptional regulator